MARRHQGPVLVDTNAILECFRVGSWGALASGYSVETAKDCVTETQTGFQRRRPELRIDAALLQASLKAVHAVGEAERAVVAGRAAHNALVGFGGVLLGPVLPPGDGGVPLRSHQSTIRFCVPPF